MKPFTPEEIRRAVKGRWRWPAGRDRHGRVHRHAYGRAGDLFVALRGPSFDGHEFLAQAAAAGCVAAVVEQDAVLPDDVLGRFAGGVIGVPEPAGGPGRPGGLLPPAVSAAVVAVTGSNGKTTVKRMIHHILSRRLKGSASPKSFNNDIGVPLTLLGRVGRTTITSSARSAPTPPARSPPWPPSPGPDVAVITSVGPDAPGEAHRRRARGGREGRAAGRAGRRRAGRRLGRQPRNWPRPCGRTRPS